MLDGLIVNETKFESGATNLQSKKVTELLADEEDAVKFLMKSTNHAINLS